MKSFDDPHAHTLKVLDPDNITKSLFAFVLTSITADVFADAMMLNIKINANRRTNEENFFEENLLEENELSRELNKFNDELLDDESLDDESLDDESLDDELSDEPTDREYFM